MKNILIVSILLSVFSKIAAQPPDAIAFTTLGKYNYSIHHNPFYPLFDRQNKPYVYVASGGLGLLILNVQNPMLPKAVDTIIPSELSGLHVTNLVQHQNLLYLSLGKFQDTPQWCGIAIVDVQNPEKPEVLDVWDSMFFNSGTADILYAQDFVYLAAMEYGIIILNVSNSAHIRFISQLIPDENFGPKRSTYHARGLAIHKDTLYVTNDNGGLRCIDVSNKWKPREMKKYINFEIDGTAVAYYNDVCLYKNIAYCSVDFCGIESVNLNANLKSNWWSNPWSCTKPINWNGSAGHANQILYDSVNNIILCAAGDAELAAIHPSTGKLIGQFGKTQDNVGSWGMDLYNGKIAIANYQTHIPFNSGIGGIQLLTHSVFLNTKSNLNSKIVKPVFCINPQQIIISNIPAFSIAELYSINGKIIETAKVDSMGKATINITGKSQAAYFARIAENNLVIWSGLLPINP